MSCTCTEGCPACLMADDRMPAGRRPLCCMSCGALEGLAGHGAGCPDADRSAAESYKRWAERQGREVAAERAAVTDTTVRDPLPAIGDYVRWENSVTGHWLEGRLVRWTKSIEGQPLARILVEQGVSPFAPGYVTGVGVGPMGLLRKVGRPGDSVSADAPRIHINPLPPMTPERADQIIAEFERKYAAERDGGARAARDRMMLPPEPEPADLLARDPAHCRFCFAPNVKASLNLYPDCTWSDEHGVQFSTFYACATEPCCTLADKDVANAPKIVARQQDLARERMMASSVAPALRPDGFTQAAVDAAKAVLLSVGTRKVGKP